MVAIGRAVRTGLRIAGKIDRKYNINKIFIDKYVPPGYRKLARTAVDAGGLGGIFISGASYLMDNAIQKANVGSPPYSQYKAYSGQPRRYNSRYKSKDSSYSRCRRSCARKYPRG